MYSCFVVKIGDITEITKISQLKRKQLKPIKSMHKTTKITLKVHKRPTMFVKFTPMCIKITIIHEITIKNLNPRTISIRNRKHPILTS